MHPAEEVQFQIKDTRKSTMEYNGRILGIMSDICFTNHDVGNNMLGPETHLPDVLMLVMMMVTQIALSRINVTLRSSCVMNFPLLFHIWHDLRRVFQITVRVRCAGNY